MNTDRMMRAFGAPNLFSVLSVSSVVNLLESKR